MAFNPENGDDFGFASLRRNLVILLKENIFGGKTPACFSPGTTGDSGDHPINTTSPPSPPDV